MDYRSLFSFEGRIGRAQYWLTVAALGVFVVLVVALAAAGFVSRGAMTGEADPGAALAEAIVPLAMVTAPAVLIATLIGASAAVRRYHDRGKSGWWWFVALIPVVGLFWQVVELGFLPGERGANRFSPAAGAGAQRSQPGDGPLEDAFDAVRAMHERLGPDPREVDAAARALAGNRRRFEKFAGELRRTGR